ncbi:MAG: type II toxin-antitoxin system RelE/ParE family toxin [Oscillospiraceae bacterium]|nr:type II toxin-antitoxin system RelE/ParE family toxin [Oscillospiraceae bacterium]
MTREFIRTKVFEEDWKSAGLNDDDLRELESILLENPQTGKVIPHLSGGRKLRFAASGRGKSGGVRVVYVDVVIREHIYLLLAYPKNVQEDLTPEQKRILNKLISDIKED